MKTQINYSMLGGICVIAKERIESLKLIKKNMKKVEKFFLKEFLNSYLEKKVFGMGNTIQKKAI